MLPWAEFGARYRRHAGGPPESIRRRASIPVSRLRNSLFGVRVVGTPGLAARRFRPDRDGGARQICVPARRPHCSAASARSHDGNPPESDDTAPAGAPSDTRQENQTLPTPPVQMPGGIRFRPLSMPGRARVMAVSGAGTVM
ncbi:hypothetical protein ACU4GD_43625 [Cupriavidus basilensis]